MKDIIIRYPVLFQSPTIVRKKSELNIMIISPQISTLVGIKNRLIKYLEAYHPECFNVDTSISDIKFSSQYVFNKCYKKHKGVIVNRHNLGHKCVLFNSKLSIYYTEEGYSKYYMYNTSFITIIEDMLKNEICSWLKETGGKVFNYHYNGGYIFSDLEKGFL